MQHFHKFNLIMKTDPVGKLKEENMLFSHSISGAYMIMRHEDYENLSIPLNSNTLNFTISELNENIYSKLYTDAEKSTSMDFKRNLYSYLVYTVLSLAILLIFALLLYHEGNSSGSFLYVSIICLIALFIYTSILCFLLVNFKINVLHIRTVILSLIFSKMLYYIILDARVFFNFAGVTIPARIPMSYMIVIELFMSEAILFYSFLHVLIVGVISFSIYVIINLLVFPGSDVSICSEISLIGLISMLKIIECYQRDMRIKHIFWRGAKEDMALAMHYQVIKRGSICESHNPESNPKELCQEVLENLKYISKVIIYKDISLLAKETVRMIRHMKKSLSHTCLLPEFELNRDIDEQDYAFITENFMKIISDEQLPQHGITMDCIQSSSTFPFQSYGVSELKSLLHYLGKSWNFDIFFIYESTGKSISLLSRYILMKWGIHEHLGIPEDISTNYFQHLEDVMLT